MYLSTNSEENKEGKEKVAAPTDSPRMKRIKKQRQHNNHGPCPTRARGCKHPPADHWPIANTRSYFCHGDGCMDTCT